MGVTQKTLAQMYPRLYHMAAAGSWESIREHGLLSTSALLDLFEYKGVQRSALESMWRPESVTLQHPQHGRAVIRDQKPMDDSGLKRCLDGMRPVDWYEHLNSRVFFWLTEERLGRMLNARAYRGAAHLVLILDTARLLEQNASGVTLAPMNTGATKPFAHPRGAETFRRLDDYPFEDYLKKRRGRDPVVELAVDQGVQQVAQLLVRLERRRGGQLLGTVSIA